MRIMDRLIHATLHAASGNMPESHRHLNCLEPSDIADLDLSLPIMQQLNRSKLTLVLTAAIGEKLLPNPLHPLF